MKLYRIYGTIATSNMNYPFMTFLTETLKDQITSSPIINFELYLPIVHEREEGTIYFKRVQEIIRQAEEITVEEFKESVKWMIRMGDSFSDLMNQLEYSLPLEYEDLPLDAPHEEEYLKLVESIKEDRKKLKALYDIAVGDIDTKHVQI